MPLFNLFRHPKPAAPVILREDPRPSPYVDPDEDLLRYPPFIKGLPAAGVDALLRKQSELIRRLQDGVGMTNEDYRALFLPVVRRFAAFVHLLPASETHHHRGSGGLLRHSLEVAFFASRASMRHVFALEREPKERYHLEPRWRVAAGLAGLLHDLGKPVADVTVSDRDGGLAWSPYDQPLIDWAVQHGLDRYYLRWRDARQHNAHTRMGTLVLHYILTPQIETWLGRDPAILANLIAVVGGQEQTSIVGTLVAKADQASVERDLRENRIDPNAYALGVPVDRYLIDAMRRLVRDGCWTVNTPGSRLWMLPDGLHVVWPQGGDDIYALLAGDNIPAIPRSPETIADVLVERGHVLTYREDRRERFYRRLAPAPLAKDGKPIELTMLLLASPELVFPGHPPAPVPLWQEDPRETSTVSATRPRTGAERPHHSRTSEPGWLTEPNDSGEADSEQAESWEDPAGADPDGTGYDDWVSAADREQPAPVARTVAYRPSGPEPVTRPTKVAADAAVAASAWLGSRGAGGRTLMALVESITAGERSADSLGSRDQNLLLPYPEGVTDLTVDGTVGEPASLLQTLWDAGMVVVDPRRPLLRVREIDGRMWTMLTVDASAAVTALVDGARVLSPCDAVAAKGNATHDLANATDEGLPTERVTRPSTTRATDAEQSDLRRRRRVQPKALAAEILSLCDSQAIATARVPEGRLISEETLSGIAAERGISPPDLQRALLYQPGFRLCAQGILVLRRP